MMDSPTTNSKANNNNNNNNNDVEGARDRSPLIKKASTTTDENNFNGGGGAAKDTGGVDLNLPTFLQDTNEKTKKKSIKGHFTTTLKRTTHFVYNRRFSILLTLIVLGSFVHVSNNQREKSYLPPSPTTKSEQPIKTILEGGYVSTGTISGSIFTGTPYRTYTGSRLYSKDNNNWSKHIGKKQLDLDMIQTKYLNRYYNKHPENLIKKKTDLMKCTKWAVVTTIFPPSDALIDIAGIKDWCTVVIGDTKTSDTWLSDEPKLRDNRNVVFMSLDEQIAWLQNLPGEMGDFLKKVPYKHFARKNIGFLYAALQRAEFVYDFDDDNYLNKDSNGNLLKLIPNERQWDNVRTIDITTKSFNHHPLMKTMIGDPTKKEEKEKEEGTTILDKTSWARGFPLELIQDTTTHGEVVSSQNSIEMSKVGIIQYCANNNPDIDAIHRLTKPLPINFGSEESEEAVLVPKNVYSPYNAQATIHTHAALFAALLPITVTSRVTDIWRGFFAQALFRDVDLSLIFAPPRITQYRNVHNILGDLESEKDLYYKSNQLVEFLHSWKSTATTLPGRMEELWIQLYERGYIDLKDVELCQLWLGTLVQIQYPFRVPS